MDVEQIDTAMTDTQVAAFQMKELNIRDPQKKALVADSRYADQLFLGVFRRFRNTFALARVASNRVLHENPKPKPADKKNRPSKHGKSFHLNKTHRAALSAPKHLNWAGRLYAYLCGRTCTSRNWLIDGTPRYKRPMWLFWTGPNDVALRIGSLRFAVIKTFLTRI